MKNTSRYLVEIRVKDWVADTRSLSRVLGYEEVRALDEFRARLAGFNQFVSRVKYEPTLRRSLNERGLTIKDYCAPDAVALD